MCPCILKRVSMIVHDLRTLYPLFLTYVRAHGPQYNKQRDLPSSLGISSTLTNQPFVVHAKQKVYMPKMSYTPFLCHIISCLYTSIPTLIHTTFCK